jgi:hypothetical protein
MTLRTVVLPLGFGLSAILCVSTAPGDDAPPPSPRPPARLYTNEDLDRVRPFRDQTGVRSVPAVALDPPAPEDGERARERPGSPPADARGRGEEYWRREAERVRDRVRAMETQADELRLKIAERAEEAGRQITRGRRGSSGEGSAATLRARLFALERRMREMEVDLSERARRARALPGWLR